MKLFYIVSLSFTTCLCFVNCSIPTDTSKRNTALQKEKTTIFPSIKGDLLSGGKANLPDYFKEDFVIVTLVYEVNGEYQNAQNQSSQWQSLWQTNFKNQGIGFYELPMIRKGYKWMSFMTNKWMRDGIPEDFHPNVITVYGEKQNFVNHLGIANPKKCFTVLVKNKSEVIASFEGSPNENTKDEILNMIKS